MGELMAGEKEQAKLLAITMLNGASGLYAVAPDPIPGPVDDIIVLSMAALLSWLIWEKV